jgi:hypothetical protein
VGQDPGLAGAGAGEHEQGAVLMDDGLTLGVVQTVEQSIGGGGGRHRSRIDLGPD